MKLPKLRPVEIIPYREGEYIIRDPLFLSGEVLVVPEPVIFVLSYLDGEKDELSLKEDFVRKYGEMLFSEDLEGIIKTLREHFLLEDEEYRRKMQELMEWFNSNPYVPMNSLPRTYSDFSSLRERIKSQVQVREECERGIISPHIDYERGMRGYALAYGGWEYLKGKTLIFLGVNHTPLRDGFILSSRGYMTPWGPVEVDRDALKALEEVIENPYSDEIAHFFEHSIELNVAFLKALTDFKMVGLLVPSFSDFIAQGELPGEDFRRVFSLLEEMAEDDNFVLVAAADLSHYGISFGDKEKAEELLPQVEAFDRYILRKMEEGDGEGFLSSFFPHKNVTRVCGTGAIYVFLKSVNKRGRLLGYFNAMDPDGSSSVSFAALIY